MSLAGTSGLHMEQAPPLAVPMAFFLVAPLGLMAAGLLLAWQGGALLHSPWSPSVVAVTHLGTLGWLGAVMLGALYQMIPVVGGAVVPGIRLAHGVVVALVVGVAALCLGLMLPDPAWTRWGTGALALAFGLFLGPLIIALVRARGDATTWGIRGAVLALLLLAGLGLRMAWGHATLDFPLDRGAWLRAHVVIALIGWVATLIVSVSWQVVPMFYLTAPFPQRVARLTLAGVGLTGVLTLAHLVWPTDALGAFAAALPGAFAVWALQPRLAWLLISGRKRRRKDASVDFWRAGLVVAPLCLLTGGLAWFADGPRWSLLFGWLAIWGYAGLIVHGMLTRIVPFLVWFHRFSALVGLQPTPPMRRLLPDPRARLGLRLHAITVVIGGLSVAAGLGWGVRLAGVGLVLVGAVLLRNLLGVLAHRAPRPIGD